MLLRARLGWLAAESVVRYDPKKDVLLVSGGRYDREQPLRHVEIVKAKKVSRPDKTGH